MGKSRGKLILRPVLGLTIAFAMLVGGQALAEPQPSLSPGFQQESDSGIIGPLVSSGSGANQRLVNLNTGLPSGSRGPLQISSVPMALGAEVIVLQGERGAMGNIGASGEQGPAGAPGIRGANGLNGGNGLPGRPGEAGSDGLDAFSIWKAQTGRTNASVTEFLSAIRGSDGANGANGKDAEFPEESMTGLVQALIPNSGDQCGFGQYQVAVSNAWSATSLAPKVECRSLLPGASVPQLQNFGLGFGNQIGFSSIATQNVEPEITPSCSVSQMFGALSLDANGALTVECVSSVYASNKLSDPKILDFADSSFEKCGAQSFVGGLGFNDQNELVIGCVDLDLTSEQSPILIDSQQCNENSSSASKVMVGLDVTITAEGKKLITIKCAPLVSLNNPSQPNNGNNGNDGDEDDSGDESGQGNNGNNSKSNPDGNQGKNQGNQGNNNDSSEDGNNGQGGGQGNNVDPNQPAEEDEEEFGALDDEEESQADLIQVEIEQVELEVVQENFGSGLQGPTGEKGDKGDRGEPGLSAYQIWLNLGNSGSESDFIAALTITSPAAQGVAGPQGPSGLNGLSAFEVWKQADASRSSSTVSDFLLSLKGEKGDPGLSAFDLWKAAEGPRASASVDDFLASLRGPQGPAGPAGLSAFEIWKNASPTRNNATEQDFLNSLNAIPAGWSERAACLAANGTLALKKCSPNDLRDKSVELTILTKDN